MQIRRDGDHAVLSQFVAQAAHPIRETKNFTDNQHGRRFVFTLRVNDERLDGAATRFDIDPVGVPRRTVQSLSTKIFDRLGITARVAHTEDNKRSNEESREPKFPFHIKASVKARTC